MRGRGRMRDRDSERNKGKQSDLEMGIWLLELQGEDGVIGGYP